MATAAGEEAAAGALPIPTRDEVPLTAETYLARTLRRRAQFCASDAVRHATTYTIDPVGAAPHGAQIHAMALVDDASILLSGGSDGYVRWYDLFASMNGKSMLTQNLRNSFVEGVTKGGVLTTWWGHTHQEPGNNVSATQDSPLSAVHSLVCQRDGLWGVSGGEDGNVNLWGLRYGAGSTIHVFRKHAAPVSALAIDPSETHLISGGWDRGVHVRNGEDHD